MNPKYQRSADRIRELIEEGGQVVALARSEPGLGLHIPKMVPLHSWLVKSENIISTVFGGESAHLQRFSDSRERPVERPSIVYEIIGILTGALSDLEDGYLVSQEYLVAGEVFDSVLAQAKHLTEKGFKDPAAVLARVVVEDTLKRLSRTEGLDDSIKASRMNGELKRKGRFPQPLWRQVEVWLDIGNDAAHGKFENYTEEQVHQMIEGVKRFLALELGA